MSKSVILNTCNIEIEIVGSYCIYLVPHTLPLSTTVLLSSQMPQIKVLKTPQRHNGDIGSWFKSRSSYTGSVTRHVCFGATVALFDLWINHDILLAQYKFLYALMIWYYEDKYKECRKPIFLHFSKTNVTVTWIVCILCAELEHFVKNILYFLGSPKKPNLPIYCSVLCRIIITFHQHVNKQSLALSSACFFHFP